MANLLVRGVDESLVRALKARAGAHGRSAEFTRRPGDSEGDRRLARDRRA